MNQETKPSLPAAYRVPAIWQVPEQSSGTFAAINQPTAGARFDRDLPVGEHPLQLYSMGTPNGQKVTILMEELDIDYDAWRIDILEGDQFSSGFTAINPNSKIPALVDYSVDEPVHVFESGSILWYMANREQRFWPKDARAQIHCMNWLMWQMGTAPFIGGGFGHFYRYAPVHIEYAINRFAMEAKRIFSVLDQQLAQHQYVSGDEYTIADMAIFPWARAIDKSYDAFEFLSFNEYSNVMRWMEQLLARPAVARGLRVNRTDDEGIAERHSREDFQ